MLKLRFQSYQGTERGCPQPRTAQLRKSPNSSGYCCRVLLNARHWGCCCGGTRPLCSLPASSSILPPPCVAHFFLLRFRAGICPEELRSPKEPYLRRCLGNVNFRFSRDRRRGRQGVIHMLSDSVCVIHHRSETRVTEQLQVLLKVLQKVLLHMMAQLFLVL